jgi:hypothetical protein
MVLLVTPVALGALVALFYVLFRGRGRMAAAMLLGVLLLASTTLTSCRPDGPGPVVFALGVAASVCVGWWGYQARGRRVDEPSDEMFLGPLAVPVPVAHAIQPQDVLGPWRFYVDAAASTVTIDLQADGRYTQAIVGNCGKRTDCPGGVWTVEGPYLELTAYRSAVRAVTEPVRWFFGEWQEHLVLFVKDDRQAETMLQSRRATGGAIF